MVNLLNQFENKNLITPTNKNEDWLYYDLETILSSEFNTNLVDSNQTITAPYYLHVVNGNCIDYKLPNGVTYSEKLITPTKTTNAFINYSINQAKNISLAATSSETISIIYESSETSISSTAIEIETNPGVTLHVKRYFYAPKGSCIINYLNTIIANDSKLIITDTNNNNDGRILDFIDGRLNKKSNFYSLNQSYLSNNSRFENRIFIDGEESNATLHGLAINETNQSCFYNTHIYHDTENSESHQLFKSMVKQNATLEYNGKVTVCPKAQQTNSYQLNQNILLDDYANVYSRPQLFIDADDVKCTHGSTTGDINAHEVFYLMSRGLDKLTSRKIVLNAFFEEVFNKDEFKSEQQDVHAILNKIL